MAVGVGEVTTFRPMSEGSAWYLVRIRVRVRVRVRVRASARISVRVRS